MQVNPLRLSEYDYIKLGRLCARQKPEVARELLSIYDTKPNETDHGRIITLFQSFCSFNNLKPQEFQGPIYKGPKSDNRKTFIAAMVRLYLPHLYAEQAKCLRLDRGFIVSLASTLKLTKMCVSRVVREVVVQEKVYPEFKAAVDEITNKLKEGKYGGA